MSMKLMPTRRNNRYLMIVVPEAGLVGSVLGEPGLEDGSGLGGGPAETLPRLRLQQPPPQSVEEPPTGAAPLHDRRDHALMKDQDLRFVQDL